MFTKKPYWFDVRIQFQLAFLPNAYKAYSRTIYIPTTVEMTYNDPALALQPFRF